VSPARRCLSRIEFVGHSRRITCALFVWWHVVDDGAAARTGMSFAECSHFEVSRPKPVWVGVWGRARGEDGRQRASPRAVGRGERRASESERAPRRFPRASSDASTRDAGAGAAARAPCCTCSRSQRRLVPMTSWRVRSSAERGRAGRCGERAMSTRRPTALARPSAGRRSTLLASNFASAARKSGQTSRRVAGPSGPTRAMSSDSRWKRKLALYAVTAGAGYYGARLGDPIAPVAAPARRDGRARRFLAIKKIRLLESASVVSRR